MSGAFTDIGPKGTVCIWGSALARGLPFPCWIVSKKVDLPALFPQNGADEGQNRGPSIVPRGPDSSGGGPSLEEVGVSEAVYWCRPEDPGP